METVSDFIKDNMCKVRQLTAMGILPTSLMSNYRIYLKFKESEGESSKMNRYSLVAENEGVNEATVIRAVSKMERVL